MIFCNNQINKFTGFLIKYYNIIVGWLNLM